MIDLERDPEYTNSKLHCLIAYLCVIVCFIFVHDLITTTIDLFQGYNQRANLNKKKDKL